MVTRARIRKELGILKRLVEATWKRYEKSPAYGNEPMICAGVGTVSTCTNSAIYLAARLGGEVYGYWIEDNPKAIVGNAEGGHDFALVDHRWLVDFWAWDTYQYQDLYDLQDPKDKAKALKMYGDQKNWKRMSPENFAHAKERVAAYT